MKTKININWLQTVQNTFWNKGDSHKITYVIVQCKTSSKKWNKAKLRCIWDVEMEEKQLQSHMQQFWYIFFRYVDNDGWRYLILLDMASKCAILQSHSFDHLH